MNLNMRPLNFKVICDDYRVLHIPSSNGDKSKLGTMFVRVEDIPDKLRYWSKVNPRNPKFSKTEKLSGQVARSIVKTLQEEPEKFALKNLGIYLLVKNADSTRIAGDRYEVEINLTDVDEHGIVNGGHTFQAIRQVIEDESYISGAYVRLHIYQNIAKDQIVELAEGLNKNLQVTNASLENLQKNFDKIKDAMVGKKGADSIAYADGDDGTLDILEVLHLMSLLDLKTYPDQDRNPHDIFGSKKKVLDRYIADIQLGKDSSYLRLIPNVHEILVLSEEVQKQCALHTSYFKIRNTESGNRVGSKEHKRAALFAEGDIGGLIPQGWLYPMISAFRANISKKSWDSGELKWLEDPFTVLPEVIESMAKSITEVHTSHKNKPGEVGRKPTAYQICYSVIFTKLAMQGKIGSLM